MVAPKNKELRPGMIAITKLGNGKYALAYEMVGESYQPIYLKFANSLDGWIPEETGKIIRSSDGVGLGSAPAIVWTPDGGECGTLIVAGGYMDSASIDYKCDWFISFDYGETFVNVRNPIQIRNVEGTIGYKPGIFVDESGKIYYVNNPREVGKTRDFRFVFSRIKIY